MSPTNKETNAYSYETNERVRKRITEWTNQCCKQWHPIVIGINNFYCSRHQLYFQLAGLQCARQQQVTMQEVIRSHRRRFVIHIGGGQKFWSQILGKNIFRQHSTKNLKKFPSIL